MKVLTVLCLFFLVATNVCHARGRRQGNYSPSYSYTSGHVDTGSAQGVANAMAERNCVSHFGGHGGMYEGCGSGSTPDQAYRNCCFANSGMSTVDVGYAQSRNGTWFCCRRYR